MDFKFRTVLEEGRLELNSFESIFNGKTDLYVDIDSRKAVLDFEMFFVKKRDGLAQAEVLCNVFDFYVEWSYELEYLDEKQIKLLEKNGGVIRGDKIEGSFDDESIKDFKIDNQVKFDQDGSYFIDYIAIDFEKKTIQVY